MDILGLALDLLHQFYLLNLRNLIGGLFLLCQDFEFNQFMDFPFPLLYLVFVGILALFRLYFTVTFLFELVIVLGEAIDIFILPKRKLSLFCFLCTIYLLSRGRPCIFH